MRRALVLFLFLVLPGQLYAGDKPIVADVRNPSVEIDTSQGTFVAILYRDKAPVSVENFLKYVGSRSYDGTIFHRVIPDFVIQGGGYDTDFEKRETRAPIRNEAKNGLKNERGTLAMARTSVVDSATNQFFINLKDNSFLDSSHRGFGYAVFGKVVSGMKVVDRIAKIPTGARGPFQRDLPKTDVIIETIRIVK